MIEQPKQRLTPTERAHEALMAALLKPAHRGSESTTAKTVTVGDMKGRTVIEHNSVRGEDETWDEYRARHARQWTELNEDATRYDANRMQRELEASIEATS